MDFNDSSIEEEPQTQRTEVISTERKLDQGTEADFVPTLLKHTTQERNQRPAQLIGRLREMKQYNGKCIILPDDPWKIKWNIFLIMVILISSIVTPLQMCFFENGQIEWQIIEFFIDIVFMTDIIFSFFSAYYNKIEALVSKKKEIACDYLKTWFIIDIIAIIPLQLVTHTTLNSVGKLARLPRIYHIIKASKFIRMMKLVKHKSTAKKEIQKLTESGVQIERLIAFFFLFLILCHNLACLWILVARMENDGERSWVYRYGYDDAPLEEQYLASLYFIITTITTVGYGDVTSKSPAEQVFCIVLMLIGVIAYSIAIGSFTSIMSSSDKKEARLRSKLQLLSHVRDQYNLSFELYWRLRQALHYDHTMDMTEQQKLLTELPSKLNVELSNIMYSYQLQGIKYFKDKCPRFIAAVAPLLKPLKVTKGEYIYLSGDTIDGIYFIKQGECAYVVENRQADIIFAKNQTGSLFGDIDFISPSSESKRRFSIKALSDMDLLFFQRNDLFSLDLEFKKQVLNLFEFSHSHFHNLLKMQRKSVELINISGINNSPIQTIQSFLNQIEEQDLEFEESDFPSKKTRVMEQDTFKNETKDFKNDFLSL